MKIAIYLSILVCLLKLPVLVFANQKVEVQHYQAQLLVKSGQILSLDVTLVGIKAICHGKLIDAHLYQYDGNWLYEIQIRNPNGEIVDLILNARNGQLTNPAKMPSRCIAETL
ncbi:hypothetical protein CXF83_19950 [Shewanella sp. Choline-02u-19]|uniref:PepSY domain-containing protein n=1 Tax=unclassified Shewanella TaxID=196818 RepID=UPI000C336CB0|nr:MULTISPECIES: hypothetical protein [unclassified Shewanella]PKG57714.1 hypothetical protein CXF82_08330 [Shewanella sp. GutDb-MelDb]PKH55465.1 hypothetical protein CXF84_18205 [Shewanella sp. Bg11-22]PKI28812.1 hypothetical protein CXF83_19950 [Shewanella sp. Choline-02u-19]